MVFLKFNTLKDLINLKEIKNIITEEIKFNIL